LGKGTAALVNITCIKMERNRGRYSVMALWEEEGLLCKEVDSIVDEDESRIYMSGKKERQYSEHQRAKGEFQTCSENKCMETWSQARRGETTLSFPRT